MQTKTTTPQKLTAALSFEREKEPEMGKPFQIYMKTKWLSSKSAKGNFTLLSTAGMGGSKMYFEANGKYYEVDLIPVFKQLIEQVI